MAIVFDRRKFENQAKTRESVSHMAMEIHTMRKEKKGHTKMKPSLFIRPYTFSDSPESLDERLMGRLVGTRRP